MNDALAWITVPISTEWACIHQFYHDRDIAIAEPLGICSMRRPMAPSTSGRPTNRTDNEWVTCAERSTLNGRLVSISA